MNAAAAALSVAWAASSAATFVLMRKVGPWWRVALGAVVAPLLPIAALAYKTAHAVRRKLKSGKRRRGEEARSSHDA